MNIDVIKRRLIASDTFEKESLAFFNATGITDPTQKNAVNYLVKELKKENLWSKVLGLYPFVGGTAFTHKFNLKDPRDLDAAFRLSFFGTITHSSDGVQGDGATGYYNTHLRNVNNLPINDTSVGVYLKTDLQGGFQDLGFRLSNNNNGININSRNNTSFFVVKLNNTDQDQLNVANNDSRGFFIGSRNTSSMYMSAKNNVISSINTPSLSLPNHQLYGLARNIADLNVSNFSTRNQAFAWLGFGITETEIVTLYNIVQQYQTILGRQV